jgi:hypothetical protein
MLGIALKNMTCFRLLILFILNELVIFKRPWSVFFAQEYVLIITGGNAVISIIIILEIFSKPNHKMITGARAKTGRELST